MTTSPGPCPSATEPVLGAVAYLNMLPFLCETGALTVTPTPRELNERAQTGVFTAGCMSAYAGLRQGLSPIKPLFGVGARQSVRSVFIEPLFVSDADVAFWQGFVEANHNHYAHYSTQLESARVRRGRTSVHLLTSGASEHSEWLARILLEAQGYRTRVHRVPPQLSFEAPGSSSWSAVLRELRVDGPVALLVIGDPALERQLAFPVKHQWQRLDLGLLWRSFSGLPTIFALWYASPQASAAGGRLLERTGERLAGICRTWRSWSEEVKWERARGFLMTSPTSHFLADRLRQESDAAFLRRFFLNYLDGLSHEFDEPFERTLVAYQALARTIALDGGEQRSGVVIDAARSLDATERTASSY